VTFWKRIADGPIQPFDLLDKIDFFIVGVSFKNKIGHFIFPKSVFIEKGIIANKKSEGKRAIRVYPRRWCMARPRRP
jgi:hypothetical protein